MKRAQASFEYLLVIAAVFVIVVPITIFFVSSSQNTKFAIDMVEFQEAGDVLIAAAEEVFYTGIGSKSTTSITIPQGVTNAAIVDQRELVFTIDSRVGEVDMVFLSNVNLTDSGDTCALGTCPVPELTIEGLREVTLQSFEGEVTVTIT